MVWPGQNNFLHRNSYLKSLASERAKAPDIAAELAVARAQASEDTALIAQQKLQIAKLQRQIYGHVSLLIRILGMLGFSPKERGSLNLRTEST
jgi:hypothetical protein